MKKVDCSVKYRFVALLLLLGILNKRISFATAQHNVRSESSEQNQRYRRRGNDRQSDTDSDTSDTDSDTDNDSDIDDESKKFAKLQSTHKMPKNFYLVKKGEETVLLIGRIRVGKTRLTNGFAGYFKRNEAGSVDTEEVKYAKNKPGKVDRWWGRASCTKMPNILFNQDNRLVFVDCPGFDHESKSESLFIQASVQTIVSQIKNLKAILCVIDKTAFDRKINTFSQMKAHGLNKLVVYLQELLDAPFSFYEENLLLVINKTGGEYTLINAQEKLKEHRFSLDKIRKKCNNRIREWNQYGKPMLAFVSIFLLIGTTQDKIICMHNVNDPNNFESAIDKIKKITSVVKRSAIKLALSPQKQKRLINIIVNNHRGIKRLNAAYKELIIAICVFFAIFASLYSVFALVLKSKKGKSVNKKDIGKIIFFFGCCILSLVYCYNCYQKSIKSQKRVVGSSRKKEEFYYEFTSLGELLKRHLVLRVFRKNFEIKFMNR